MPANILNVKVRNNPAWWDSEGVHTFSDTPSASEAFERYGLDYKVVKKPAEYEVPIDGVFTLGGVQKTRRHRSEKSFVMLREPVPEDNVYRELGVVSESYTPVQNMDIASALDPLTTGEGGRRPWPVAALGTLRKGAKTFCLLEAGESEVRSSASTGLVRRSDNLRHYFLVTDHKAGGGKLHICFTPVRVVCENTEVMALGLSDAHVQVSHNADVKAQLRMNVQLVSALEGARDRTLEIMQAMAEQSISIEQAGTVFSAAYPAPSVPGKGQGLRLALEANPELAVYLGRPGDLAKLLNQPSTTVEAAVQALERYDLMIEQQRELQADAALLYEKFNDENPAFANTAWAAYNAVTELADWREGNKNKGVSVLLNQRAREKALASEAAAALVLT